MRKLSAAAQAEGRQQSLNTRILIGDAAAEPFQF
jgi:hypothetical protein